MEKYTVEREPVWNPPKRTFKMRILLDEEKPVTIADFLWWVHSSHVVEEMKRGHWITVNTIGMSIPEDTMKFIDFAMRHYNPFTVFKIEAI